MPELDGPIRTDGPILIEEDVRSGTHETSR